MRARQLEGNCDDPENKSDPQGQAKKLKLKKETLKDLDASKATGVRGGMLYLSGGKGCDVEVIQDKQVVEVGSAKCLTATCAKVCA
jgi:hypothetical protein